MIVVIIQMKMLTTAPSTHAHQMNSDVIMAGVSLKHGNVITKTIVKMVQMKSTVSIHHALTENLLALMVVAYHKHKCVMVLMIVRIMQLPTKHTRDVQLTPHAQQIILNAKRQIYA